ncbi:sensor histidine kinase [Endothiovibrio diazotrophicus]
MSAGGAAADQHWRPLWLFNGYRAALALLLTLLFFTGAGPRLLGEFDPRLFGFAVLGYLGFSFLALVAGSWRWPSFNLQVYVQLAADVVAITLLMHASGGLRTGIGMLLIAAIAGGGLLLVGRTAVLFAALAALAVLGEQVYAHWEGLFFTTYYTQAGILGAAFFATALLAQGLAGRVRESEQLARRRGEDLESLERLNAHIIRHLEAGILVVGRGGELRLANEAARELLGLGDRPVAHLPLAEAAPALFGMLERWRANVLQRSEPVRLRGGEVEVLPRFARMGVVGCLILLEESAALAEQAQRVKLASLGRLTASIAHEVRNPLGAISHAGQLLAESPALEDGDRRLTEIILEQSQRVNAVIENVLNISRREAARPQWLDLGPWSGQFVQDFLEGERAGRFELVARVPEGLRVHVDATQLQQVMWNLCQNSLRYGRPASGVIRVELRGGTGGEAGGPWLEVTDNGPGIPDEAVAKIFEPFYTKGAGGTGLGLYLARELCEANQAHLGYRALPEGGACFRISFADPERHRLLR